MMLIRPATFADVPAILPMVADLVAAHERHDPARFAALPDVLDRYARWLPQRAADPDSVVLVAVDTANDTALTTSAVVGFVVATIEENIPIYQLKRFGYLHDLYVLPGHRRRGVSQRLLEAAAAEFKARGITQVRCETAAFNEPARAVLVAAGWRTSTIDMLMDLS